MHDILRKARSSLIASAAVLGFLAAPALAEERKLEFSTTITGTSDYIFRGLSLNDEDPAYQQSLDISYGIFYAGVWGSMVAGNYEPVELDWYAGFKPEWGPVTFDIGVVYYTYFWADDPDSLDYVEFKLGAEFSPITNLTLKPVFWYVPDQSNSDAVYTIEGTAAYEFRQIGIFTPTLSGLIGYSEADSDGTFFGDLEPTDDYTYWNVGLALSVEKFTFDFRYWDTNIDGDGLADERFVFTASITLP
jgi:uncharacterized protein (TIGR02001 family)